MSQTASQSNAHSTPQPPREVTRREFFGTLAALGFLGFSGLWLIYVILHFLFPPKTGAGSREKMKVATEAEVPEGGAKSVKFGTRLVWLVRMGGEFRAFDASCTHLGCPVKWDEAKRIFNCPCHGAHFDANGRVISPPAPRPLEALKVEVRGGEVYIGEA